jgi:uncharacterized SAM-dependent methyltransferase
MHHAKIAFYCIQHASKVFVVKVFLTKPPLWKAFKRILSFEVGETLREFLYDTPQTITDRVNGASLWKRIYELPNYYIPREEVGLIAKISYKLADHMGKATRTLYDLGPGTRESVLAKTGALIKAFSLLERYVAIDVCDRFLEESQEAARSLGPSLWSRGVNGDIYDFTVDKIIGNNNVFFLSGSTVSALGHNFINAKDDLGRVFEKWIDRIFYENYFLITQDATNDEGKLLKAYVNKESRDFALNVFYRIKRDLGLVDFDPEAFEYDARWNSEIYAMEMLGVATRTQTVVIDNQKYTISQGFEVPLARSYKLPPDMFLETARAAGFSHVESFNTEGSGVYLHLLQKRKPATNANHQPPAA